MTTSPWELKLTVNRSNRCQWKTQEELKASYQSAPVEEFQREFYRQPVLRVPSVIIPREHKHVLLPAGDEFSARILWVETFRFDQRLFSSAMEA